MAWHNVTIGEPLVDELANCPPHRSRRRRLRQMALAACGRRGIAVCNVPDYGVNEVADHAIALMLALGRGILRYHGAIAADPVGGWTWRRRRRSAASPGSPSGRRHGRIGTAAARRGRRVRPAHPVLRSLSADRAELGWACPRRQPRRTARAVRLSSACTRR